MPTDLKKKLCTKNPGHQHFIPAEKLTLLNFPANYQQPWRLNVIKAMSDLTVFLSVEEVSQERPDQYPGGSNVPYPFRESRGRNSRRTGSGFVYWTFKCGENGVTETSRTCWCPDCVDSPNPKKTWWRVCIHTSRYIVYNDSEAKTATLRFFFNESDSERNISVTSTGELDAGRLPLEDELFQLQAIVCDTVVGERLEKAWKQYRTLRRKHDPHPGSGLVVVVSHPHGCAKYVTLGSIVKEEGGEAGGTRATYTADTCPGSGGGMVWAGGWGEVAEQGGFIRHTTYHHSHTLPNGNNRSGLGGWDRW